VSPVTHFFASWLVASAAPLNRREKAAVVCAGLAPDIDGLGLIPELITRNSSHPLLWFSQYHHMLHTLAFAIVVTAIALLASRSSNFAFGPAMRRPSAPATPWTTALLAFLSFHLHLLCDLIGSRSPDGYQWPIAYLQPFSSRTQLVWQGQWRLNSWENMSLTFALVIFTLWLAGRTRSSPLELVSQNANYRVVEVIHRWRLRPQPRAY
jgi:inner membrane protein